MKIPRKILAGALFGLLALPALASAKQDDAFDCGWLKMVKPTNPTLPSYLHEVLSNDFECFTTGGMRGGSSR